MHVKWLSLLALFASSVANAQTPPIPKAQSLADFEWVTQTTQGRVPANSVNRIFGVRARCPGNKYPVSGGYFSQANYHRFPVTQSIPAGNAWEVKFTNSQSSTAQYQFVVYVLCATYVP